MSDTIVGAFIGGICAIIGAIISPIITYKLNNFSKIHRISKNNTKTNEVTRHDIDKNRTRKNKLATPISNGGLIITPPGSIAGSARGGFAITISTGCLPWRLFYLLASSSISFSSCSRI